MSEYQIDKKEIPSLHISEHLKIIKDFYLWLNHLGIDVSKSRISFYIKFLEEYLLKEDSISFANETEQTEPVEERIQKIFENLKPEDFKENVPEKEVLVKDRFAYVLREVHDLMWIYKGFKNRTSSKDVKLFKTIIGGQWFSRNDTDRTARNYQLEARVASYFLQVGYEVQLGIEADVKAESDKDIFYIECKRLNSATKVYTRIKKAAKQLKKVKSKNPLKRNIFGIAVFDVTKLAFPHDGLTWGMSYDHCRDTIQSKLKEISRSHNFAEPFQNNKNVILIWLQIFIPSYNILLGHQTTRFSNLFLTGIHAGYRGEAFERLQEVIEVGPDESFK